MAIRNYSTGVSPESTVGEIRKLLARNGAREIAERYDGHGRVEAMVFSVETRFGERRYVLPANPKGVFRVLERDWQRGRIARGYVNDTQARRTAWRNIKDWISLQFALVETGSVTVDQVMLPYMEIEAGRTVYDVAVEADMALPAPPQHTVIALPAPRSG